MFRKKRSRICLKSIHLDSEKNLGIIFLKDFFL